MTMGVEGGRSKGGAKDESDWFRTLEARVIPTAFGLITDMRELAVRSPAEAAVEVAAD